MNFPHWFMDAYNKYNDDVFDLPEEQEQIKEWRSFSNGNNKN